MKKKTSKSTGIKQKKKVDVMIAVDTMSTISAEVTQNSPNKLKIEEPTPKAQFQNDDISNAFDSPDKQAQANQTDTFLENDNTDARNLVLDEKAQETTPMNNNKILETENKNSNAESKKALCPDSKDYTNDLNSGIINEDSNIDTQNLGLSPIDLREQDYIEEMQENTEQNIADLNNEIVEH